jgi:hypothetical protein
MSFAPVFVVFTATNAMGAWWTKAAAGASMLQLSFGGAVAQLGARLDGIEEVVGSNHIGSTNFSERSPGSDKKFFQGH